MTTTTEVSAGFEPSEDGSYLQEPSPKRVRYDHSSDGTHGTHPVMHVSEVEETVQTEDPGEVADTLTITVPSSQFEIEINSQVEEEDSDEIPQIQRSDLTGPAFDIVHDPQELVSMDNSSRVDDGGTLTAIGRALLQMQQGGAQNQQLSLPSSTNSQQIFLTRASSISESSTVAPNAGSPLYVMIPPASSAEILQAMGQTRPIAPKTTSPILDLNLQDNIDPKSREAQRKATHNEVERRRRDRINELIKMLAMIVPGCQKKDATTGNVVGYVYSKGTVLDKTVEYLKELITHNEKLAGTAKMAEKSASALHLVQNQIAVLEKENAFLRAQIIQFGIDAAASSNSSNNQQQSSPVINRQVLNSPLAQSLLNTVAQCSQQSALPPPPPPPLMDSNTPAAAQQLLISLAQSLTNSPLLTSLSQNSGAAVPLSMTPHVASSPSHSSSASSSAAIAALMSPTVTTSPARSMSLPQVHLTPPIQVTPAVTSTASALSSNPPQVSPLISTLIQTLASIANTNAIASAVPTLSKVSPTRSQTPPQTTPTGGGLSAAAAASLLNTLIMAQNVLTNSGGGAIPGQGGGISISDLSSVLGMLSGNIGMDRGES